MIGFIYALINSSVPGLVKIGRTDRDPELRARELSAHTGVAAPFVVAFQRQVNDSEAAERFIHAFLEAKGLRVSGDREFFRAPLHEIVQAIVSYHEDAVSVDSGAGVDASFQPGATAVDDVQAMLEKVGASGGPKAPWESLLAEGEAYHSGEGDHLQDYREALRLYRQAAALGSGRAHRMIGEMYERGEGVGKDQAEALEEYKRGLQKGEYGCHAAMAMLFRKMRHSMNEAKCWDKFFEAVLDRLNRIKQIQEALGRCDQKHDHGPWEEHSRTLITWMGTIGRKNYVLWALQPNDFGDILSYLHFTLLTDRYEVPRRYMPAIEPLFFMEKTKWHESKQAIISWLDAEFGKKGSA